jgi:hypothetical protein
MFTVQRGRTPSTLGLRGRDGTAQHRQGKHNCGIYDAASINMWLCMTALQVEAA